MILRNALLAAASLAALSLPLAAEAQTQTRARTAPAVPAAALPDVDIPYTKFVLNNGLTLLVHEDHKAPIVAVNIWYHVGSKNEPEGRSGFAHLFEHLMFNGSENFNDDFFKVTERIGATSMNGTTNTDRTNYFENVPVAALDTVLWLESDRMGHLLGAVDQAKLDEQRGVVQNEKRQGENQPYGMAWDMITKGTYADDHPYGHTVIGSMDDLNAAKLADVQDWFRTWYGPANAVIVLAGDITPAQAKAKVEQYFGAIPPGPPVAQPKINVAKMTGARRDVAYDQVAQPRLYKVWNIPQVGAPDNDYLQMLSDVLVSDKNSRLYKRLVFDEQVATSVSASADDSELGGQFAVIVTAKPDQDLKRIEAAVDAEMAKLLAEGPTQAELEKIRISRVAGFVKGLERIGGFGGKSDVLAQSQVYRGSPDAWKSSFDRLKTAKRGDLQAAGKRWLSDGSYALEILPFPAYAASGTDVNRKVMPEPGATKAPAFPKFERAKLSNGMEVILAERHSTPTVGMRLMVDTGFASDYGQVTPGTGPLAVGLMDDGTRTRGALEISDQLARLGANLSATGGGERSFVAMDTLTATLDPSLQLFADVVQNPAYRPEDFKREQALSIARIQASKREPAGAAGRILPAAIYGPTHPYGRISTEASVGSLTRDQLAAWHDRWFKPNNATLIVVGDTTMAQLRPKLEAAFANWRPSPTALIDVPVPPVAAKPVVYLVDKPGAIQSYVMAAVVAPKRDDKEELALETMNTVLGGAFVSRINMNLREDKHWSYGARSGLAGSNVGPRQFVSSAAVQTDKTKESIVEMRRELVDILKDRPVTPAELASAQNNIVLGLPGVWETNAAVASYISDLVDAGLPDDYYGTYADRIRATTGADMQRAAGLVVKPDNLVWVVVGDLSKIESGVRSLNLGEVRVVDADGRPVGGSRAQAGGAAGGR